MYYEVLHFQEKWWYTRTPVSTTVKSGYGDASVPPRDKNRGSGTKNGELRVENGEWRIESGKWKVENGKWKTESGNGEWKVENESRVPVAIRPARFRAVS